MKRWEGAGGGNLYWEVSAVTFSGSEPGLREEEVVSYGNLRKILQEAEDVRKKLRKVGGADRATIKEALETSVRFARYSEGRAYYLMKTRRALLARVREAEGRSLWLEGKSLRLEQIIKEADGEIASLRVRLSQSESETRTLRLRITWLEECLGRAARTGSLPRGRRAGRWRESSGRREGEKERKEPVRVSRRRRRLPWPRRQRRMAAGLRRAVARSVPL